MFLNYRKNNKTRKLSEYLKDNQFFFIEDKNL